MSGTSSTLSAFSSAALSPVLTAHRRPPPHRCPSFRDEVVHQFWLRIAEHLLSVVRIVAGKPLTSSDCASRHLLGPRVVNAGSPVLATHRFAPPSFAHSRCRSG